MRLSEYASTQRTYGSRKVPRSVQQSIPIDQIYEDGTWRCGNVYSQMWSMPDINFTMSDEDNKAKILNLLGKVYMGVPSDCWLKICIVSQRMDEKSFRENVLLHRNLDGLDKWLPFEKFVIIVLESTILCSGWRVWKTELHPKHKSKGKVKKIAFK